jgi:hypothetical protein
MSQRSRRRTWVLDNGLRIKIADRLYVSFQRTRRLDPSEPPIAPPSYGVAPVAVLDDGGEQRLIVPLREDEAVWLGLSACDDHVPSAVRVIVREPAEIDATTGSGPLENLSDSPQNYVVVPPQHGVAGVFITEDRARQFVRVTRSSHDAPCQRMELIAYAPTQHMAMQSSLPTTILHQPNDATPPQTLEGKGLVIQRILHDPHGINFWNETATTSVSIDLTTPEVYTHVAGREAPGPLTDASKYGGWRLP